jgi:hypothetical protein
MDTIKAVIRNGRIETDVPLDLPEGTELLIPIPDLSGDVERDWDNSPEGIAAWLDWADSIQPLVRTEQEAAEAEAWLKKCDQYAALKLCEDVEGLFR